MSNVTCLSHTALIYIVHLCGLIVQLKAVLTKLKVSYNNSFETIYGLAMAQQC